MKNILTLMFVVALIIKINAQPIQYQSAVSYFSRGQLEKAKNAIDPASLDTKTSTWAKTWYYKGEIYLNICISKEDKYKNLDTNALLVAYDSYQKAIVLDKDKEYFNQIIPKLLVCGEQYYNRGVIAYNKKLFSTALPFFERTISINTISGKVDTLATYNAALSAEQCNKPDVAKKYYNNLIRLKFRQPSIYFSLQKLYKKDKDTNKALEVIQKGLLVYPDNLNLIIEETNIYLAKGNIVKAQENLQKAIAKEPKNPNLYFAIGSNYDKIYNDEKKAVEERLKALSQSEESYKKAIELKADYFDANYNLGALYNNEAARILEGANLITDDKLYNAEKAKADVYLQKALPYLEKANQLQPTDKTTLLSLKKIYAITKQYDKIKEIDKQLNK